MFRFKATSGPFLRAMRFDREICMIGAFRFVLEEVDRFCELGKGLCEDGSLLAISIWSSHG